MQAWIAAPGARAGPWGGGFACRALAMRCSECSIGGSPGSDIILPVVGRSSGAVNGPLPPPGPDHG